MNMASIASHPQQQKRLSKSTNPSAIASKKKRFAESRPHPPDCLNKRYWDDVRAGRIPDPSKKTRISTKEIPNLSPKPIVTQSLESTAPQTSDLLPLLLPPSNPTCNSPISTFPRSLYPLPFAHQVMPIMNYFGTLPPPPLPPPSFLFGIPSVSSTDVITPPQPLANPVQSNPLLNDVSPRFKRPICSQSTSDDEVDRIADEMITNISRNPRKNVSNSSPLCIIPFPVPVPIVLPLTTDFVYAHYGSRVFNKK